MHLGKSPWQAGFEAGAALVAEPPYKAGTVEAEAWMQGWLEGAFRLLDIPHFDMPPEAMPPDYSGEREKWRNMLLGRFFSNLPWPD